MTEFQHRTPNAERRMQFFLYLTPYTINDFNPASSIQHPASSIQHPVSSIQYPASSIQHPVSSIQHPVSSIRHPESSGTENLSYKGADIVEFFFHRFHDHFEGFDFDFEALPGHMIQGRNFIIAAVAHIEGPTQDVGHMNN